MSIIKHVTLQKIVAHDFRYDSRTWRPPHRLPERTVTIVILVVVVAIPLRRAKDVTLR